ncbi:MAG: Fur family transcriptional regulator [Desulfitobacteriia bacterium]|jgi:Fe2+ or Zn2+ uptake regulation protein
MTSKRSTKQRRAILSVFSEDHLHLVAEDVYQIIKSELPNISLGTVYRNLDRLSRQGTLIKTVFPDGKARYERANPKHHHHMICLGCSDIIDILECPLREEIEELAEEENFLIDYHRFEIFGYCKNCHLLKSQEE